MVKATQPTPRILSGCPTHPCGAGCLGYSEIINLSPQSDRRLREDRRSTTWSNHRPDRFQHINLASTASLQMFCYPTQPVTCTYSVPDTSGLTDT